MYIYIYKNTSHTHTDFICIYEIIIRFASSRGSYLKPASGDSSCSIKLQGCHAAQQRRHQPPGGARRGMTIR